MKHIIPESSMEFLTPEEHAERHSGPKAVKYPCVVLPPGYTLLERECDVILAFNPNNAFGRYATWKVDRTGNGVHTGHYIPTLERAVEDWKDRIRRA